MRRWKTTEYFDRVRPLKHPEVSYDCACWVAEFYTHEQLQSNGRIRRQAFVEELQKVVRVVSEIDGATLHNAFIDRSFRF